MEKLKVEYIDPYKLIPYEHNAKKHGDDQIAQIEKSIKDFGMNDPIGVWSKQIDLKGSPHNNLKVPHTHYGYEHNEYGNSKLSDKDSATVDKIVNYWQRKRKKLKI